MDNSQPGRSDISQAGASETVNELPKLSKLVRSKSFLTVPKVGVLQERSNGNAVFQFTGSGDSKIVSQPLPGKKTANNSSARRQQAYKARPAPRTDPQNSDRLKGVRLNRRFQLQMKYRDDQNEL